MAIKFLKDLVDKPYEVRLRIFWFIMIAVAALAVVGWLFLIKNYKFSKEIGESDFKLPSFDEIIPANLANQFKNIGNDLNTLNNRIQSNNHIGNSVSNNAAAGNVPVPLDNNFRSENNNIK